LPEFLTFVSQSAEADKSQLKSLSDIEVTVREQLQTHVSPQIALFLSKALQASPKGTREA
jgi:hypothetical protein